ncbi:MAG TPA: hypothetical protein DFR83_06355, partial [Deltaproteobacteria bacterium]|nr:hypothetical protein [Deltaproteobacteria bacterium]
SLDTPLDPALLSAGAPDWVRYMLGSIAVFVAHVAGPHQAPAQVLRPFVAAVAGDVPTGAGLSSSAALTVAWMNALAGWADHALEPTTIIQLARQVEHQWLGVQCGALDQTASQMGRDGHLLMVDFQPEPLSVTPVRSALPNTTWLVLHTGVQRGLAHSEYSSRVQAVTEGLAQIRSQQPAVGHWRDLTLDHVAALEPSQPLIARRLRHGVTENTRVRAMVEAIQHARPAQVGALLNQSHASLRDDYGVSCPELDAMCALATARPGVWGARMVGAGFGGCALALADANLADGDLSELLQAYQQRTGRRGTAYRMRPGPGAERLV